MRVTLLCSPKAAAPEQNLEKIVCFMGPHVATCSPSSFHNDSSNGDVLIAKADAFCELWDDGSRNARNSLPKKTFIYGFNQSPQHQRLLNQLSPSLVGVETTPAIGARITVENCRAICQQLSGMTFESRRTGSQAVFKTDLSKNGSSVLMSASGKPFMVSVKVQDSEVFLMADDNFPDLDEIVPQDSILDYLPGLMPVMAFLRYSCPREVWHNDQASACFIVDDPPLKKRYGFLDFQELFQLMRKKGFSISIAFIPWNFKRSDTGLLNEFGSNPERFSLCVHGCDHTWGEFDSTDLESLQAKSQQALDRMIEHQKLSGVGFDEVMVFPQGLFSTTAMKAVKSCGYLAAVNSRPHPMDAEFQLSLRELLDMAVTRFHDFPVFFRRYPHELAELAFDLFLGRPAFLVEHHGFFGDGLQALAATIDKVNRIEPGVSWTNLATACSTACLKRAGSHGEIQAKFFTDRFTIQNSSKGPQRYVLIRTLQSGTEIKSVAVDGRKVKAHRDGSEIRIELSLEAGQEAAIRIEFNGEAAPVRRKNQRLHQAKVFLRRSLSELRVNYLERNPFVSTSAVARD